MTKIYDFSFKTGSFFGEASSPKDDTNIQDGVGGTISLNSPELTGINQSRLSLNGQTLVEQTAIMVDVGFSPSYLNSGDYYFRSGESFKNVKFDSDLVPTSFSQNSFLYNLKDNVREAPMGTGANASLKSSSIRSSLNSRFPDRTGTVTGISSFDYFLNGQKIYSGVSGSYYISGATNLFYFSDEISGKIFGIPKNTGLLNTTGSNPDIFGQKFVEKTVFTYVNGFNAHPNNWLETHTGVKLVVTGLQSRIFEANQDQENISL